MNQPNPCASLKPSMIRRRNAYIPQRNDVLNALLLEQGGARRLEKLLHELGVTPGDRASAIDLALQVAHQALRHPILFGTRVKSKMAPYRECIVVGTKPEGFRESWEDPRIRNIHDVSREALIWTVDPTSRLRGISQSRLSDWTILS